MPRDDELDLHLLERDFAGETTPEERERLDLWVAAEPGRAQVVASLRQVWESGGALERSWDVGGMWDQLTERIGAHERQRGAQRRPRLVDTPFVEPAGRRSRRFLAPLAAAAAVVVAVAGGAVWWGAAQSGRSDRAAPPALREFATARGERAEVRLADATRVLLGPASTLRIPTTFGEGARDVYLDGEAFFEVTHDERRPFNVHAGSAVARDLGTKFSVSAYAGARAVQVVVAEGLVALKPDTAPDTSGTLLRAGDLGRLTEAGETAVIRDVDLDRYLDWTTGRLVFDDVALGDAIPRLERWYDVTIVLADNAMAARHVTATFKDQSVSQALDALALLLGARIERDGKTVRLSPRPAVRPAS